jgi:UDP-N-acetylglucosamine 3-dehydrogenase
MVNVGVIGIGNMGRNHARVYTEIKGAHLVAISDIKKEGKDLSQKLGCNFYQDYSEMLKIEDIEAVSICAPTSLHREISLKCIESGKHILVEKPIADGIKSAKEIIEKSRKEGVTVMVGHIERFNPAVTRLKKLMKKRKIGEITSIMARRVGVFPPQIKDANVILDLAVHDIDIFNYILEKRPDEVYAKAGKALVQREDHALITLDYEGIPCFVQVNWITPVKIRELSVTGTKGYAELNYLTQELRIYESFYEKSYDSFGDFIWKFGTPKKITVSVKKEEPLKIELKHFIDCIEKGKEPLVTGEDGLIALEVALAAIQSHYNMKPIKIGK